LKLLHRNLIGLGFFEQIEGRTIAKHEIVTTDAEIEEALERSKIHDRDPRADSPAHSGSQPAHCGTQ
jgi:hypothetical protein